MRRIIKIAIICALVLIIAGIISLSICKKARKERGEVFSDKLTTEEIKSLQEPITLDTLASIIGKISSVQDIGSGRHIYTAESEKYGYITLFLENNSEVNGGLEIMKCIIANDENPYVLFGKYQNPKMNGL